MLFIWATVVLPSSAENIFLKAKNEVLRLKDIIKNTKIKSKPKNAKTTQKSKNIALEIIKDINNEGFFEGDEKEIAKKLGVKEEEVKKVRERFMFLEPVGVGAKDLKEAFLFQLYNLDIGDEVLTLAIEMVKKLEKLEEFATYNDSLDEVFERVVIVF